MKYLKTFEKFSGKFISERGKLDVPKSTLIHKDKYEYIISAEKYNL